MKINRFIINKLYDDFLDHSATILIGARQVGKTFLLKEVEEEAKRRGLKTAFFDLEQPDDLMKFKGNSSEIIKLILNAGEVIFIDEFHYLKNVSKIFKAIYDGGGKVKIFASGSSSVEIHKHLKESLAGRKFIYKIFPCSYSEISQVVTADPLEYYCRFGGMPGLIHFADEEKKKLILSDIIQSYLLKDIKSLVKEENIRVFNNLLYLLAQYQGSIISTSSLAKEVGMASKTIESYLEIMNQTYVCFPLHSFSKNYGNELKKSKKYYLYDIGVRNGLLKNFEFLNKRDDAGIVIESFVFGELQKRLSPETEIRFWRLKDGKEVDFIWIKNQRPYPIEVKTTCKLGDIPGGLKAFLNRYPNTSTAFIVSMRTEGDISLNKTRIAYVKLENTSTIPDLANL